MIKYFRFLFFAVAMTFVVNSAKAQYYYYNDVDPISVGINMGTNMSTMSKNPGFESKAKWGVTGGVNVDYNFPSGNLTLASGLMYHSKQIEFDGITDDLSAYFLSLPVHLLYNFDANDKINLKIGGGGYVAMGLGGEYQNKDAHYSYNSFNSKGIYKSMDAGLGVSARATVLNVLQLTVGYDFGLINMSKSYEDRRKIYDYASDILKTKDAKFRTFYVTIGMKVF